MISFWSVVAVAACGHLASMYFNHAWIMGSGPGLQISPARRRASLIVPALNEEKYIGDLLASALSQTESFAEIIVADSGVDGTQAIAEGYGAKVVKCEPGNVSNSRNVGASVATGEIFVFADADQHLAPNFLESCIDYLEDGNALVYPREMFSDSVLWNVVAGWGKRIRNDFGTLLLGMRSTAGCVGLWAEVFDEVGGYDVNCNPVDQCWEDRDFGTRVVGLYGIDAVKLMPMLVASSARRWNALGPLGGYHFDESPRHYLDV